MRTAPPPVLQLLDAAEAADLVRMSVRSIRRRIASGEIPAVRTSPNRGGKLLIRRADLLAAFGLTDEARTPEQVVTGPRRGVVGVLAAEVAPR